MAAMARVAGVDADADAHADAGAGAHAEGVVVADLVSQADAVG